MYLILREPTTSLPASWSEVTLSCTAYYNQVKKPTPNPKNRTIYQTRTTWTLTRQQQLCQTTTLTTFVLVSQCLLLPSSSCSLSPQWCINCSMGVV